MESAGGGKKEINERNICARGVSEVVRDRPTERRYIRENSWNN